MATHFVRRDRGTPWCAVGVLVVCTLLCARTAQAGSTPNTIIAYYAFENQLLPYSANCPLPSFLKFPFMSTGGPTYVASNPAKSFGTALSLDTATPGDDLDDLFAHYKAKSKETHLVHKQFDHILTTPSLLADAPGKSDLVFKSITILKNLVVRGKMQDADHMDVFWKIPQEERDVSDHYPVVAEFEFRK